MFPCFTSEKVYARLLTEALRTCTTLPSHHPHPWTRSYRMTKIRHGLCLFIGWDVQAVPGWGCPRQPRVPAFWSYDSSVPGSAAEEQPQDSAGRERARNGVDRSGCCPPLACSTFFLTYRHLWWLKMGMQKPCPDFSLYQLGKYVPGYNMA